MQTSGIAKVWPAKTAKRMLICIFIAFVTGFGGYLLAFRGTLLSYLLAHLGALGALGLIAWVTGFIAMKKGRHFYSAFLLACMVPILSGICVVLITEDSITCGGSISLAASLIVLTVVGILRRKKQPIPEAG